ncbi:MAG: MBOAT family protein [Clostridiales bacterium]|nr:MBOAT family protein [Clostridiales bacterium]
MVFSSLLFVYAFLPACFIIYIIARKLPLRNAVLLIFSLVFYAWGEPKYVLLLIAMTFADWLMALIIQRSKTKRRKKSALVVACIINLGLLGIFKYGTFTLLNMQYITGLPSIIPQIALPIGISFYTFQLLSYVVDVYRGEVKAQKNFALLLLYAGLFHQCIAGPIVRYKDVERDITSRTVRVPEISRGITRFTVGLAKKAVLANLCGALSDMLILTETVAADAAITDSLALVSTRPALALWAGMLMYMFQIYLDFSAYSDMAIGMGLMMGFHYRENFNYPYTAKSVTDFWRRWHISLSTFFRDYVYIPLGGNRKGAARTYFNLFVVWLLTGMWHGASWNYILWGLYFFVLLSLEKAIFGKKIDKIPAVLGRIYLLIAVYFGWVLFRFSDFNVMLAVLRGMFGQNGNVFTNFETNTMLTNYVFFIIIAVVSVTPLLKKTGEYISEKAGTSRFMRGVNAVLQIALPIILLLLSTICLVGDSYNPFLYFQF